MYNWHAVHTKNYETVHDNASQISKYADIKNRFKQDHAKSCKQPNGMLKQLRMWGVKKVKSRRLVLQINYYYGLLPILV